MQEAERRATRSAGARGRPGARAGPGRRGRKKARTRAEIVGATLELLAARPFDALTVEQICAAADVARGTFFLHFGSKLALLAEIDAARARALSARIAAAGGGARSELRALLEALIDLEAGVAVEPELGPRLLALASPSPLRDLVQQVVRRGQARGELRRGIPASVAAAALLATCAAARAALAAGAADAKALRSQLLQSLLHGLAEAKPRLKWRPDGAAIAR